MNYILHLLVMIFIYVILGTSLNIAVGYAGILSLAQGAFYGIGAYITALLMVKLQVSFWIAVPAAVLGTMVLGYLVAKPSLRLKGDFLILATIGFQMIIFSVLYNWEALTKGPYGISGIPKPSVFGFRVNSIPAFLVLALLLAGLVVLAVRWLIKLPFGRTLQAVREDEMAAMALGKDVVWYRTYSFVVAAGLAAAAGSLYATYVTYIDPTSFTLDESIFILSLVVIGGAGSLGGPWLGATILVLLPELLRFLHLPDSVAPNVRQIIYGLALVLMMRFRPQGILGKYRFDR